MASKYGIGQMALQRGDNLENLLRRRLSELLLCARIRGALMSLV